MAMPGKGYDPEAIEFLQQCLDISVEAACRLTGARPGDDLKQRLASAIIEGSGADISGKDELVDYALRSLSELRHRPTT